MHVHFDGDLLVYRAGFAAEKQLWHVLDPAGGIMSTFTTKREAEREAAGAFEVAKGERDVEPVENALHNVRSLVEDALEKLGVTPDEMTMYLSGSTNYREGIATIKPYKGNRDPDHKPVHGPAIREYMHKCWNVVVSEDEEADDVVGYSHYKMWLRDEQSSIICSVDKDLDMIPGMHYNFVKEDSYYVPEDKADYYFYCQLLTGDSTDNIPGIPGVGPKRAGAILEGAKSITTYYERVKGEYEKAYPEDPLGALVENARLLWIRRQPNEWWLPPVEEDACKVE
jgi:hypothetical protein